MCGLGMSSQLSTTLFFVLTDDNVEDNSNRSGAVCFEENVNILSTNYM